MTLPVTVPINYPSCSSKILETDLQGKGFSIDYIYRIFGNSKGIPLKIQNGVKGNPYMELIIPVSSTTSNVYSNYDCQNSINTNDGSQLNIKNPAVTVNDKRFWLMDQIIELAPTLPSNTNDYISVKFKTNSKLKANFKFTAQVQPSSGGAYTVSEVTRQTIWVYNPLATIYLLINYCDNQLKIYAMQTYCNQVLPDLNPYNLPYLGSKMNLPKGWTYAYIVNDGSTYFKVVSTETAYVVQDEFNNTYQYVDPTYESTLYQQYDYLINL